MIIMLKYLAEEINHIQEQIKFMERKKLCLKGWEHASEKEKAIKGKDFLLCTYQNTWYYWKIASEWEDGLKNPKWKVNRYERERGKRKKEKVHKEVKGGGKKAKKEEKKKGEQGNREPRSISTLSIDLICLYHRSSPKRRQRERDRIHV